MKKLILVVALFGVVTATPLRIAGAQPASGSGTKPADDKDKGAAGEDDTLYSCKKKTGNVAVTFKPETELKDLIAWVMGFTCKNFILDPRIVSTGKKVTVIAPLKMSPAEGYSVFPVSYTHLTL